MSTPVISHDLVDALRLLADILQRASGVPGPRDLTRCVTASTDVEGTAAIDDITIHLDRTGTAYQVEDTDHNRTVIIPLTEDMDYRIFYVYRAAMDEYHARDSYYDNIAPALTGVTS